MTATRYLTGVLCGAIAFVPLAFGVRALRRRYFWYLEGPVAFLASVVLAYAIVLVGAQLLGTVGLLRLGALTALYATTGVALVWRLSATERRPADATDPVREASRIARGTSLVAVGAVAVVAGQWAIRTADSLRHGMITTADTAWYHMPTAARFVQTGYTSQLHYIDANSLIVFYPNSSELTHAIGVAFMRGDVLSPLVNLGFLALVLLAAWCCGRPYGVAPVTLVGAAAVLATPEIWLDDAGSALNDVVALALLLSAVALLLHLRPTRAGSTWRGSLVFLAALAAGGSMATKYTVIPAVGVFTVGLVLIAARGRRVRTAAIWLSGLALTGSYWYLRNLLATGSPLPSVRLGIGPVHLPTVPFGGEATIAEYLFDGHAWGTYFVPGLRDALGPVWWALLALTFAGFAFGLAARGDRVLQLAAVVGAASFVAYLYSPQILGLGHMLVYFVVNVRYVAPAMLLGIVVLPLSVVRFGPRALLGVFAAYVVTLVATQFDRTIWRNELVNIALPTHGGWPRVFGAVVGVLVLAVGWFLWARRPRKPRRMTVLTTTAVALIAVLVAGYYFQRSYERHWFRDAPVMLNVATHLQDVHDARIALIGSQAQYIFYGSDLSNYVQYIAKRDANRHSSRIADCASWRRALNRGRYDYVVVTTPGYPFPTRRPAPEADWTGSDDRARLVYTNALVDTAEAQSRVWLYRIDGRLDPSGCPAAAPA